MIELNLLYYSNAFIANHGGRLHSEAFLKEASLHPSVSNIEPYPSPEIVNTSGDKVVNKGLKKKLKENSLLQAFFFYRRNFNSYKEIVEVLNKSESKIDVLHIRVDSNFLIIPKLKKRFPELIITTEVNASPFDENFQNIAFRDYYKNAEKKCLQEADANFFVSEYLKETIMTETKSSRDFVVHNGVALDSFPTKMHFDVDPSRTTFGYVGTLDYHKNLLSLINAFNNVHAIHGDKVSLKIFGDGPMYKDLKDYIYSLNLDKAVHLAGWVDHKKVADNLSELDIAIHHSANPYMSPLKIFEYMAVGVAVIGPDIPSVREIFEDGEDLLLVKKSQDDLTAKMIFLLENKMERKRIASTGNIKVRENYGWDSNAANILQIIKKKFDENN
ncbi:glycosyltransferase family 4 protein [Christiangramia sediminis]|uniref:Glycosyltransferase family 4 protein n=1 Tax=Christiangramia sediminis TaxID=2881336 RepID=A0A9X1LI56_9FLAO|nr:glycosyltransferase family 4 protein [Christiangramia sediminis]MCB7480614.1 glycosyltransferase family 4 protein [Christiangramia sediminis]